MESQPPDSAIHDITEEACKTLERIDPRARLRRTGQFNHSFLPDVVADWPGSSERPVRPVYLRFDLSPALVDDIQLLAGDGPLFLALTDSNGSAANLSDSLRTELAEQRRTLAARPDALEAIADTPARNLISRLVSTAFVQGGRGLLEREDAERVLSSADNAYESAQRLNRSELIQPLAVLNDTFAGSVATDAVKTLHMLWWASGGSPEQFPDSSGLLFDVGNDDIVRFLNYLFEQDAIDDASFWQRLGQRISAPILLQLGSAGPTANLQRLIEQNLVRLRFKAAAAEVLEQRMSPLGAEFWWYVARDALVLAGSEFELTFVTDGRHFNSRSGGLPLSPDEVKRRVENLQVESVEIDDERRVIGIRAKDSSDGSIGVPSVDDLLRGEQGSVTEVTVRLPDGPRLRCNYDRSSAFIDDGEVSLASMARFSSRLLLHLDRSIWTELRDYVQPRPDVAEDRLI